MKRLLITGLLVASCLLLVGNQVFAEECSSSCNGIEECQSKIDECQKLLQMSVSATKPHEEKIAEMEANIAAIEANVKSLSAQIDKKKTEIMKNEGKLVERQTLLESAVREFYKKDYQSGVEYVLSTFFSGKNVGETMQLLGYRQSLINQQKTLIAGLVLEITDLSEAKKKLEETQRWLAAKKQNLEATLAPIRQLVLGAKAYQSQLTQTVGTLSARQQQLLAEKTGNFVTSVGEVPPADDPASRPDYNPGFSPAYAGFSFGAPHRKGMSQYGALGRAKLGQSYEEILRAYYGDIRFETVDTNSSIPTTVGSLSFEDNYLKGIAEMPTTWADQDGYEALKAQAVAARSYALAYTGWRMGDRSFKQTICTTESCQVYNGGKAGSPGRWGDAVNDTKGKIMVSNQSGEVVNAFYASTSGGYQESYSSLGHTTPGIWDTPSGREGWTSQAYEKQSGSPWFYKGWYKTRSGTTCGRSHPWLTSTEFADIVNAVIVYQDGGDMSGVFPEDIQNCYGGADQPWAKDRVRGEAKKHRGGLSSVSSVSVVYSNGGTTAKVVVDGREFDGQKFYKAFNLRAPGAVHLKSGLFNIEKK